MASKLPKYGWKYRNYKIGYRFTVIDENEKASTEHFFIPVAHFRLTQYNSKNLEDIKRLMGNA